MKTPAALAFAVTIVVAPAALRALRRAGVIDRPTARSSHFRPTVRGGGLAPAAGAIVGVLVASQLTGAPRTALLVVAVGYGLVGLAEDLVGIPPLPRLALHVVIAACAVPFLLDDLGGTRSWQVAAPALVVVGLVAYVNAFNFMDGINGISVVQVVVAGGAWFLIGDHEGLPGLQVAGLVGAAAIAGFAPWNVPRARMFLGDVGSYFFGGWLAALAVMGLRWGLPPEAAFGPLVLYMADTGMTLLRRLVRGGPWAAPHRDHTYQRLTRLGWPHLAVSAYVACVTAACALLGAASLGESQSTRVVADGMMAFLVLVYLALPGLLAAQPRRASA